MQKCTTSVTVCSAQSSNQLMNPMSWVCTQNLSRVWDKWVLPVCSTQSNNQWYQSLLGTNYFASITSTWTKSLLLLNHALHLIDTQNKFQQLLLLETKNKPRRKHKNAHRNRDECYSYARSQSGGERRYQTTRPLYRIIMIRRRRKISQENQKKRSNFFRAIFFWLKKKNFFRKKKEFFSNKKDFFSKKKRIFFD